MAWPQAKNKAKTSLSGKFLPSLFTLNVLENYSSKIQGKIFQG